MKVKIVNTGRNIEEAEVKVNLAIQEIVENGDRVLGLVDSGMRVMITFMPMPKAPAENPIMPDGNKRYVTPEEMKEIEKKRKKDLPKKKKSATIKSQAKKPRKGDK